MKKIILTAIAAVTLTSTASQAATALVTMCHAQTATHTPQSVIPPLARTQEPTQTGANQ